MVPDRLSRSDRGPTVLDEKRKNSTCTLYARVKPWKHEKTREDGPYKERFMSKTNKVVK